MSDERIIIGAPDYGFPQFLRDAIYVPGCTTYPGETLCDHKVILSPASLKFLEEHSDYKVICSECVESYTIIHGPPEEGSAMVPGAREEMEQAFGKEETDLTIKLTKSEMERRIGAELKEEENE